ncbi:thiamine pyrophosphate-requiring protein [Desertibaculum subflavum]|uniref:thiamine pyrophosphate-requiring protein n=1 Tax=Desertibaculum subflavum TaxID=2268458 RepID=UPI000E674B66
MAETQSQTAAEALLTRLKTNGIDYLFANGGTDFAPVIEGLARASVNGAAMPEALPIPHETAAIAMAHGLHLVTGKPQAVMVHTNVGLANAVMGLINAAADNIPLIVMSGRTPVTEQGRTGSRNAAIHWGQEMRDQAAMVRECTKWDYELRFPEQAAELVDRAVAIATSAPTGPVYMSLPREVLCQPAPAAPPGLTQRPALPALPEAAALAEAAALLAKAERPLIIAQRSGDTPAGFAALVELAEALGAPVVEHWPVRNSMPTEHALHAGFDPHPLLAEADAVLVVDALVPWMPDKASPPPGARVIQIGPDPLFSRFPVRGYRADLALAGDTTAILAALAAALEGRVKDADKRRAAAAGRNQSRRAQATERARAGASAPMTNAWVSHCVSEALKRDGIVFSELGVNPGSMAIDRPGQYFAHALSGGLGWGLPAALGAQLADRDRLVVASIGDGSYQFANPISCHQVAEAQNLPVLTIVFNNGIWNAVRRSTLAIYGDGHAARANRMPVTSLAPSPDYAKIVEASRGFGQRVERGEDLPKALDRAIDVIRNEKRQALLDVSVAVEG